MHRFEAYKTLDGQVFESEAEAKRHASKVYGDALYKLAHKLVKLDKYKDILDFLDSNLLAFAHLTALKKDEDVTSDGCE